MKITLWILLAVFIVGCKQEQPAFERSPVENQDDCNCVPIDSIKFTRTEYGRNFYVDTSICVDRTLYFSERDTFFIVDNYKGSVFCIIRGSISGGIIINPINPRQ